MSGTTWIKRADDGVAARARKSGCRAEARHPRGHLEVAGYGVASLPHRHPLGLALGTALPQGALATAGEGTDAGCVAGPRRHGHRRNTGTGAGGTGQRRGVGGHGAVGVQIDTATAVRADVRGCVRGTEDAHGRVSAFQTDTLRPGGTRLSNVTGTWVATPPCRQRSGG